MEDRVEISLLMDIYSPLLTEKQKNIMELYYNDDLSLAEIAQNDNVSRNNVHKHLKSSEEKLLFYEEKLGLYKKDKKTKAKIDEIKDENLRKLVYEVLK